MALVNPWDDQFARPALKRETKEFQLGDRFVSLTFEELDELAGYQIADRVQEWTATYLGQNGSKPRPLMAPDKARTQIPLSHSLLRQIAILSAMDRTESRWGLIEWAGLARNCPDTWNAVLEWVDTFGAAPEGNPTGESSTTA